MVVAGRIEAGGTYVRYVAPEFPLLDVVYATPRRTKEVPRAIVRAPQTYFVGYAGGSVTVRDVSMPHDVPMTRESYAPLPSERPYSAPTRHYEYEARVPNRRQAAAHP